MVVTALNMPVPYLAALEFLARAGFQPSRSEVVRRAVKAFLAQEQQLERQVRAVMDEILAEDGGVLPPAGVRVMSANLPREDVQALDRLVREGRYGSRSEAARVAVRAFLGEFLARREHGEVPPAPYAHLADFRRGRPVFFPGGARE